MSNYSGVSLRSVWITVGFQYMLFLITVDLYYILYLITIDHHYILSVITVGFITFCFLLQLIFIAFCVWLHWGFVTFVSCYIGLLIHSVTDYSSVFYSLILITRYNWFSFVSGCNEILQHFVSYYSCSGVLLLFVSDNSRFYFNLLWLQWFLVICCYDYSGPSLYFVIITVRHHHLLVWLQMTIISYCFKLQCTIFAFKCFWLWGTLIIFCLDYSGPEHHW